MTGSVKRNPGVILLFLLLITCCRLGIEKEEGSDREQLIVYGDDSEITSDDISLSATSLNIFQDEATHVFAVVDGHMLTDKRVTFSISPASAGTMESSGLYIPDIAFSGTATITARSVGNGAAAKDLEITVNAGSRAVYVDDNNPGVAADPEGGRTNPYNTITEAVSAAAEGSIIRVAEGTYNEQVVLGGSVPGRTVAPRPLFLIGGFNSGFNTRTRFSSKVHKDDANGIFYLVTGLKAGSLYLINGFTIGSGRRGIKVSDNQQGGGVVDSRVIISNNLIENNHLPRHEEGMPGRENDYVFGGGIDISMVESFILNNTIRVNSAPKGPAMFLQQPDISHTAVISNNIFSNNSGIGNHCGGVYLMIRKGVFLNNLVKSNKMIGPAGPGGGVLVDGGRSTVFSDDVYFEMAYNTYIDNYAITHGGAVFIDEGANVRMHHELMYENSSGGDGAAIAVGGPRGTDDARTELYYSTIAGNTSLSRQGDGLMFSGDPGEAVIRNCIFFNYPADSNGDDFLGNGVSFSHFLTVDYCIFNDALNTGEGNFKADPLFHDAGSADFHLKSTGGRWNPATETWETDTVDSPGIGAAYPDTTNLGRYGRTGEQSIPAAEAIP